MNDIALRPADHVRLAASGTDLFVLDVALDRYLGLPGAIATTGTLLPGTEWRIDPDAAEALVEAGLLCTSPGPFAAPLAMPTGCVERVAGTAPRPTVRQFLDLLWATLAAGAIVRRGSTGRQLRGRTTTESPTDESHLTDLMARLETLRLFVPTPRRCLPAALATCLWLRRQGVAAEIVFGVRSHPFEAHCWAEHAGLVLDDDPDRIRGYSPIAVSMP